MNKQITYLNVIGKLIFIIGILVAIPLLILPFYPNETKYFYAFAIPSAFSLVLGFSLSKFSRPNEVLEQHKMNVQKGSLTVLIAWVYGFIAGATPFVLTGELNPLQAFFEAVSGWTTTGLSVIDVSKSSHIFLLHRSFMQFCGGLGFVMVMVMFIQGKQAMTLYNAEGHADKLMPNLKKTAWIIFLMYSIFMIVGTLFYFAFGMDFFDGLNHAMCALSTGGFSTKLNSFGDYNSIPHEVITIILMLIGTTNFAVLLLFVKRKFKQVSQVSEIRFMFVLLAISIPVVMLSLMQQMQLSADIALRTSAFNVVSALSTSGFATIPFSEWPQFAIGILIVLMLIGGGIGSTAGGIKMSRVYLMIRVGLANVKKRIAPAREVKVPHYVKAQGKTVLSSDVVADTASFFFMYIVIFIVGSLLITLGSGSTLVEAMFEFASALGTVGLSIGVTTIDSSALTLIVEIIGMIMGRLEIFIVIVGIYSGWNMIKEQIKKTLFRFKHV